MPDSPKFDILLLHGMRFKSETWACDPVWTLQLLHALGYRVVALALPGNVMGLSSSAIFCFPITWIITGARSHSPHSFLSDSCIVWEHWPDILDINYMDQFIETWFYMCIQWTRVLHSVVIIWLSNSPFIKCNSPFYEFTSVWSMFVYTMLWYKDVLT